MKRRVLLIDDEEDYLTNRKRLMENEGSFIVHIAATLEAARELLDTHYIHLAAIDVFMDPRDEGARPVISGLTLVHDPKYAELIKLVVTSKERNAEDINDALRQRGGRRLAPAVGYLNKDNDWRALVQKINEALDECSDINWRLANPWPFFAFEHGLVAALNPERAQDYWRDHPEELQEHCDELTDLLRIAFRDYDRVRVERQVWLREGRLALAVIGWRDGDIHDRIVILGRVADMARVGDARRQRMPEHAPPGHAHVINTAYPLQTLRYAAETLELPGAQISQTRSLRDFYNDTNSAIDLRVCVDKVLESRKPVNPHLQQAAAGENADRLLRERAGLSDNSPALLRQAIQTHGRAAAAVNQASITLSGDRLIITQANNPKRDLPDPANFLARPGPAQFEHSLTIGASCGTPPTDAILVAPSGRNVWLTDYAEIGHGPLLSTLAALEAQVKFELHAFDKLIKFAEMEEELLRPTKLDTRLDISEPKKAVTAIKQIRGVAQEFGNDMTAYLRAMFYETVAYVLAVPPPQSGDDLRAACACLDLGLLAERLGGDAPDDAPSPSPGLYIDQPSRRVFLNGQLIELTPRQFSCLLYLYNNARHCCSKEDIVRHGLPERPALPEQPDRRPPQPADFDRNFVPQLINTLRARLGNAPERYLATCQGGYILFPDGRPDTPPPSI